LRLFWLAAAAAALAAAAPAGQAQEQRLLDMVLVAGGTFRMGDTFGDGRADEQPVHPVTVSSFYLSKFEVTVGQFAQFVQESGYTTTAERLGGWLVWTGEIWERKFNASWRNPYFIQGERDPVVLVSWYDAVEFCNWLSRREKLAPFYIVNSAGVRLDWSTNGYRLPTEAEWEYAARAGGQEYRYAWGNGGPEGNVADEILKTTFPAWPFLIWSGYQDGYANTAPVGSFRANELRLHDLSGNVWEWCNDWYGSYSGAEQRDPRGPAAGETRTLRGGAWSDSPAAQRAAFRSGRLPEGRGSNSGFRPARSVGLDSVGG
jgi:formylglycine-generating enzyme required for sulfatase activity